MAIDVNAIVTDAQLDEFMGGQLNGGMVLRPVHWTDSLPARRDALERLLRYFRDATPTIGEELIVDPSILDEAIRTGAAARVYELALMGDPTSSGFSTLFKNYTLRFEREMRKLIDGYHKKTEPDRKGRGRRTVDIERR